MICLYCTSLFTVFYKDLVKTYFVPKKDETVSYLPHPPSTPPPPPTTPQKINNNKKEKKKKRRNNDIIWHHNFQQQDRVSRALLSNQGPIHQNPSGPAFSLNLSLKLFHQALLRNSPDSRKLLEIYSATDPGRSCKHSGVCISGYFCLGNGIYSTTH